MVTDVSKATILILLVLTIVISVLSTIIILDRAEQLRAVSQVSVPQQKNTGLVSLSIARDTPPQPDLESGKVSIKISE